MNLRYLSDRKRIDNQNRITIPPSLMRELDLQKGDVVDIYVTDEGHILIKIVFRQEREAQIAWKSNYLEY